MPRPGGAASPQFNDQEKCTWAAVLASGQAG